jgi:mono/diheme cytochrome c family protein
MFSRPVQLLCVPAIIVCALLAGCRKEDMSDQPKYYKPYKQTIMFADGTTARPIPAGTIARGHLEIEDDHYRGKVDGKVINYIPIPIGHDDLVRGQQKFMIYCAVCHGAIGDGKGMVATRGMVQPPSLVRVDRPMSQREYNVQHAPIGHYFDVITNGYGAMYSYNDRVAVDDRWRISAYIRALQLSQDADLKVATMRTPPQGDAPVPVQAPPTPGAVTPDSVGPTTQP